MAGRRPNAPSCAMLDGQWAVTSQPTTTAAASSVPCFALLNSLLPSDWDHVPDLVAMRLHCC